MAANPFLAPSPLPFGYPDFSAIREEHFLPAFVEGMARQRAEVDAIAADPAPPTFENTLVALERSGDVLRRVSAVFFVLAASSSTEGIRAVEAEVAPLLAAHADAIRLDPALFARIEAVAEEWGVGGVATAAAAGNGAAGGDGAVVENGTADGEGAAGGGGAADTEDRRLVERYHRDAVRAGARLGPAEQERLRAINAELSSLTTEFGNRLLAGAAAAAVHVTDPSQLDGLTPDALSAAARAARSRGLDGHLLTLVLPTEQPALAALTHRDLRERLHTASVTRGLGGEHDTRATLLKIVTLRAERARLLGHPHHASWVVETATAASTEAVDAMLHRLAPIAAANARAEADDLAASAGHPIAPWDRAFHAERVRRERFAVDAAALRPYLELERVLHDGVFHAAHRLYGLSFAERHDLPTYHPDVRVFDVSDDDGPLGLFVADLYARDTKRGGAWMNAFVSQSHLHGTRPVVLNTLNIPKPADGEPTLLTLELVRTLFHEFGHALHGLFSDVRYPLFAGTAVPRDFVEYPSQVNEMWLEDPEILAAYARHHETGEPLPPELITRIAAARRFGEGAATTEYLAAALLDQAWHRLGADAPVTDVEAFEAAALNGVDVPSVPPRYRSTYFNHVFGGAYSAGYYSYIWSEVLDADTVEWFTEHGGLRRENGERFRRELLARGGAVDPMAAYEGFRGRAPDVTPLLVRRGLQG
jgi:peptidyl-dipeptidase Dcp